MSTTTEQLAEALRDCEARLTLLVDGGRSKLLDAVAQDRARAAIARYDAEQQRVAAPERTPRYIRGGGGAGGLVIDTQAGGGGIPRCEQGRPIADAFGPQYADLIVAALNAYPEA